MQPGPVRARACVEVQTGCDHRCTFCIIPFGRGDARSRAPAMILAEVRAQVAAGAREVVLTGVDITSFGQANADRRGRRASRAPTLGRLVRRILAEVPELPRLRLSSIDAAEIDADLLAAFAEPRLMPYLHLSLQSGDDLILKRMKRRHRGAQALATIAKVRAIRPETAFGADFIVGFPTESEAAFAATLDFAESAGLAFLHVFPFSPRPGTPAARMPQVSGADDQGARQPPAGARRYGCVAAVSALLSAVPPACSSSDRGSPTAAGSARPRTSTTRASCPGRASSSPPATSSRAG